MHGISVLICPIEEVIERLCDVVKLTFLEDLADGLFPIQFEVDLDAFLRQLNEDLFCLIEFPYVDKVYRDTYYTYFSTKHYKYSRDCIRVSLFKQELSEDLLFSPSEENLLNKDYLGYFIIRPTKSATIGRSFISPIAFKNNNIELCLCTLSTSLLGIPLIIKAFPHSTQDEEVMLCAETTVWAIMEYFGNRYSEYSPVIPSRIHHKINHLKSHRQVPSAGLTMDEISFVLKEFGFGTYAYSKYSIDTDIYVILKIYIESGIPVVVGLENDAGYQHAIVAVGKKENSIVFEESKLLKDSNDTAYFDLSKLSCELVYQDDNLPPYQISDPENIGVYYQSADISDCADYKIDSLVVPLYSKIYLEAMSAKPLAQRILTDELLGYKFPTKYVFRFYLTSSRSLKKHISTLKSIDLNLKKQLLLTRMPKFVWCAEIFSNEDDFNQDKVSGLILLDATEANSVGLDALIFAGYPNRVLAFDDNNSLLLPFCFEGYKPYNNLTCLKP